MKHRPTKAATAPAGVKWPKGAVTLPIPIYNGLVVLTTTMDDYWAVCKWLGRIEDIDEKVTYDGISFNARHNQTLERIYVVGVFDDNRTTLMHELAHTTFQLHADIGMDLDYEDGNCESFTYLQGYLYDELKQHVVEEDSDVAVIDVPVKESQAPGLDSQRPLPFSSVFEVRFFPNDEGQLCCAADGDLSDYKANKEMAVALATLSEHLALAENVVPRETASQ